MKKEEIRFQESFNDEIGLGSKRSEMTDDIVPGSPKVPPITVEEEAILEELGLGKNPTLRNIVEDIKDDADKQ